jgi:maltose alpha-D-glucosyltransferase / alpha-amylase
MAEPASSEPRATGNSEPVDASESVEEGVIPVDPTWFKDAVVYELHVRAFCDSTADGTGDFVGLTSKLDYLRDLGVTALWLLPFYPSPLRDDGYDISDYTDIHPSYGNLTDFRTFLRAAHARGIRVINELVLNHTSDTHPWFQRARRSPPDSPEREFYLWSDTPNKFLGARVIFNDTELSNWSYDPVAKAYYFHRFYSHQPDLNYDNPAVARAIYRALDFWLEMGVDGLRLDAVPYLYKREGTNCENLPETHAFLKALRAHVDARFPGRMLLAEANQWPEDAAAYFGAGRGDECHTAFHFPLMPRLFMAVHMGNRFPVVDMLNQTPKPPEDCQWLIFLRNHDELTLEMVSDEERDYMYRVYARDARMRLNMGIRRRLAPLLRNDRRIIELMNGLLFSLPGTPVVYYGDEIGMGDNIYLGDRNGVRTPMQWSPDRNAGFSRGNPQRLYFPVIIDPEYHYESVNVESQLANPQSLLWHMRRLIALRRQARSLGRGDLTLLGAPNNRVLAYVRRYSGEQILVVANLSHLVQAVDLDLREYRGLIPIEMFGHTSFPAIGDGPYRFSLGPYAFFWFRLEAAVTADTPSSPTAPEPLVVADRGDWATIEKSWVRGSIEQHLPNYLMAQRWFRGKGLFVDSTRWLGTFPLAGTPGAARLGFVRVHFTDADSQTYLLPLGFAPTPPPTALDPAAPRPVIGTFRAGRTSPERQLVDVAQDPEFARRVLSFVAHNRRRREQDSEIAARHTPAFDLTDEALEKVAITPLASEQSNTSVRIGEEYILKLFRVVEAGENPETELGEFFLTHPGPVAALAGVVELTNTRGELFTLASVHRFVPNEGNAWGLTLDHLHGYFDRARAQLAGGKLPLPPTPSSLALLTAQEPPAAALELVGGYLELVRRLGQRTAEFHCALASEPGDPRFAPQPFDSRYARSIYQTMQAQRQLVLERIRSARDRLPDASRALVDAVLAKEEEIDRRLHRLLERRFSAERIRVHGDYHLGQVLWTGKDFVIIDLEGEPLRAISERRIRRSPLKDIAGMLRSFDYAARAALRQVPVAGGTSTAPTEDLQPLADLWVSWAWTAFLKGYRTATEGSGFVPRDPDEFRSMLGVYVLDKAIYEVGYELNNRPAWLGIPLRGLVHLLNSTDS